MRLDSYDTLGGEGCPALHVAEAPKNHKSRNARRASPCRFEQERVGNMQKYWHTADTAAFDGCSALEALHDEVRAKIARREFTGTPRHARFIRVDRAITQFLRFRLGNA